MRHVNIYKPFLSWKIITFAYNIIMLRKNLNVDNWADNFIKHSLRKDAFIKSESYVTRLSFYFYILVLAEAFNIQIKCSIKEIKAYILA